VRVIEAQLQSLLGFDDSMHTNTIASSRDLSAMSDEISLRSSHFRLGNFRILRVVALLRAHHLEDVLRNPSL